MLGDPRLLERFWTKVQLHAETGCWKWTGAHDAAGYGSFKLDGSSRRAHRLAYLTLRGEIPAGLVLDHICRVRDCVNPDHLRPLTIGENVLIGVGASARNKVKTHCKRGHEFTPENTWRTRKGRTCAVCERTRMNAAYAANPEPAKARALATYRNKVLAS